MAKRITDSHIPRSLFGQGAIYASSSGLYRQVSSGSSLTPSFLTEIGNKIHRENGPAIYLDDGTALYFWHGLHVPQHVIVNPESITLDEILSAVNIEYKRILIERYGQGKFLTKLGGEKEREDKYGTLWLIKREKFMFNMIEELSDKKVSDNQVQVKETTLFAGEDLENKLDTLEWTKRHHVNQITHLLFGQLQQTKYVQVRDATTTSEIFFIQVPNKVKTPREAIAWSFKLKEEEYDPVKES